MSDETGEKGTLMAPAATSASARPGSKPERRKAGDLFAAALGIGRSKSGTAGGGSTDAGTLLAHQRTGLAMERTYWAAERTLMAWIRTTLSMISFGFTLGKIGQALQGAEVKGLLGLRMFGVDSIAYLLVALGTVALLGAAVQYSLRVHALRKQGMRRQVSIAFAVSLVLSLLGIFAFTALVMRL